MDHEDERLLLADFLRALLGSLVKSRHYGHDWRKCSFRSSKCMSC
jgi:hypothetical protein